MSQSLFDLSGKVAFVTGGNGGLGKAIALGLAAAGADVVVAARNADKSKHAVEEIQATGRRALAVSCDVTDAASVAASLSHAVRELGGIDILVNNSGTSYRAEPQDIPEEEWDRVVDTNLKGTFLVSKLSHPYLKARGGGKIINIGSMMSIFATEYASPYAASKGGVVQFTKACAVAWAKDNIQANAILPGWFHTDMTGAFLRMYPEREQLIADRTPAGRWGRPDELSGTAIFLASRASNFVTGTAIPVDGGYSVKS